MHQRITNPATLAPLATVIESSADEIGRALAAAAGAAPAWRETPGSERAALLRQVGARIHSSMNELVELASRESGQPRCESLDAVRAAARSFEFFAVQADRDDAPPAGPDAAVAVLAPVDLALPAMAAGIARALAAGRCVVGKPPAQSPLASLGLARAFEFLPAGAASMVIGGADVGRTLIAHPQIDTVVFTGSAAAGLEVAQRAQGKTLDLEAVTGSVHIVDRSADLDLAVPAIAWNRLMSGGQGWASGHLYVERSIAAELVERMHQCVGFLDVDDPSKAATDLGPLISADAALKVEDQVGRTLREGAKLILGGRRFRPSGLPGHFFQPTILADVNRASLPLREMIAGPVITVTPVADLGEALRLWRESARPVLSPSRASIYTGDAEAARREVAGIGEGFLRINDPAIGHLGAFSGLCHRGIRLALGSARAGAHLPGTVEISPAIERKPWWFPYLRA